MSVASKCRHVTEELVHFYRRRNIETITEHGIRNKISHELSNLNKILKFHKKVKTLENIQLENKFQRSLNEVFGVEKKRREIPNERNFMETDAQNEYDQGILTFRTGC